MTEPKLELVEWEDSTQPASEWQWLREVTGPNIVIVRTAGWVIFEDITQIRMAMSLSSEEGDPQVVGIIAIPQRAILSRKEITQ